MLLRLATANENGRRGACLIVGAAPPYCCWPATSGSIFSQPPGKYNTKKTTSKRLL